MKKILSIILSVTLCLSAFVCTAEARDVSFEESLASDLKLLGLFQGVSETDFDLNRAPTRLEALVMLIRLLGQEEQALESNNSHPFADVPAWASSYVGYAYHKGLTNGVSATAFGTDNAGIEAYLTFVLRALGYSDENGADFLWNNPFALAKKVGILPDCVNQTAFLRADVVTVSYAALAANLKDSTKTLAQKLITDAVFTYDQYLSHYRVDAIKNYTQKPSVLTAEEIYKNCAPAVFYIEVYDAGGYAIASGSGFFIDENGTAVTNYHVIDGAYTAKITESGNGNIYDVRAVLDYNKQNDWAVLQIDGSGFPYLPMGDGDSVSGGATVYAIGSPLGLQNTISNGLISNVRREIEGVTYLQTTAAISHGSSGGALINQYGEVIGITSASFTDGENLGLALPISVIEGFSRENPRTLYDLAVGKATKPIDQSNLTDASGATVLLSAFVDVYANDTIGGDIAYTERLNTEKGYVEFILSKDEDGRLQVTVWEAYGFDTYFTTLDLNGKSNERYFYYSYNTGKPHSFTGYGTLHAAGFTGNNISFTQFEGVAEYYTNVTICLGNINAALTYIDTLFEDLADFGQYSVRDLGFASYVSS